MYTKICINIVARSMEKSYPPGLGEYKKKKRKTRRKGNTLAALGFQPMRPVMFYSSPRKEGVIGANAVETRKITRDDVFRGWRRHTRHAMCQ